MRGAGEKPGWRRDLAGGEHNWHLGKRANYNMKTQLDAQNLSGAKSALDRCNDFVIFPDAWEEEIDLEQRQL